MDELHLLTLDELERPERLDKPEASENRIDLMVKQARFVLSKAMYSAYGGGVGNGKSLAGIIKVYQFCEENPGALVLVGRKHATDLRDSTRLDFLQMMNGYGRFRPGDNQFDFPNGSRVIFRHLDDLNSLTNMNLSGFWVDQAEEIAEETFDYLNGRVRRQKGLNGGILTNFLRLITFNPNGHDWIWRLFDQHIDADGHVMKPDMAKDYFLVVATTYENRENLPEAYIRGLEGRPKEWRDRFIYGSFDVKAGKIFEEFNPLIHVIPSERYFSIPLVWERFRAIDHGQNNPTACLWNAVDFESNIFVYQEYYQPSAPVSKHTAGIKNLSRIQTSTGYAMDDYRYTIIDPSTFAKTREKNGFLFSVADEYMDAGLPVMRAQNDVLAGINRVKEYLKVNPNRVHPFLKVADVMDESHPLHKYNIGRDPNDAALGSPRLFIFARCENLIRELPEYIWQPLKYNQIGMQNSNEKPVKNNDHATDALRYAIMSRPVSPQELDSIDPMIWNNPMELVRFAKRQGMTKDELIARHFNIAHDSIRTSDTGIGINRQSDSNY